VEVTEGATATRFWMLEPVRQFAVVQLESDSRLDQLHARHLDWWVQHATDRPVGEQWFSGRWVAELRDEFDNLRQAITYAVDTGRVDDAATLLGAIHGFCMDGFSGGELDLLADAVLRAWADPPARFWLASAIIVNEQGRYGPQAHRLDAALENAVNDGDIACEAFAADWVSSSLANTDPERARTLADTALTAARLAGDPDLLVLTLAWTAMTAHIAGDTSTALERFDEADRVAIDHWSIATSQLDMMRAFVALDIPEAGDPETLLERSYTGAPERGFHSRFAALYRAFPRAQAGDIAAVSRAVDEAFELSIAHGLPPASADVSIAAAELLENLGHLDNAAAIIAALHRQPFTSHAQYHRYRQARSRLPSATRPDRQLTLTELHDLVEDALTDCAGRPPTTGTPATAS
jgi:hypothetical protein